jgi:hypothetical protein
MLRDHALRAEDFRRRAVEARHNASHATLPMVRDRETRAAERWEALGKLEDLFASGSDARIDVQRALSSPA